MKLNKLILPIIACALMFNSCDDQKMEWGRPDGQGDVNISDIPLELAEKLANYDFIKKYAAQYMPNSVIGIGLGADLYISDEAYKKVADENFQMITTGNAMKHASVVKNNGALDFTTIDKFFDAVPADMKIYGHTLLWHTQQRASYLNALIAPEIIVEPDDKVENVINNSDFETGNTSGWGAWSSNGASQVISAQGEGYESDYAMKLNNPVAGANYSAQAYYTLPTMTLELGETYVYSLWVYSVEGNTDFQLQLQSRTSYSGNGYKSQSVPAGQWHYFEEEFEMTEAIINVSPTHLTIDFGAASGVYYIDNVKFGKKKSDPMANVVDNSDFETGNTSGWGAWSSNGASQAISAEGEGYNSNYSMKLNNPVAGANYSAQAYYTLPTMTLELGETYMYSLWVYSVEGNTDFQMQLQNRTSYSGNGYKSQSIPAGQWHYFEEEFEMTQTIINVSPTHLTIDFGAADGVYFIDNVKFGKKNPTTRAARATTRGVIEVPKTDEDKKALITGAMEDWISGMMDHCKDRIMMWDVLNEPVDDSGVLRGVDGNVPSNPGEQEFYWGQYLGKDYAVKAFQLARQYSSLEHKLFINDYNLESVSTTKLNALIDYVKYIDETNGSPIVDGIGTQMHLIAPNVTRAQIDAMFKTMAATGKLIRVTELDVRLSGSEPESLIAATAAQFEQQAQVYQWVFESYKENVPQAQQSGITIWSLTDDPREHEYWLKNDRPNIFDKDYGRKHAYKGVCDGIAGYDISTDFNGSDWNTEKNEE